MYIFKCRQDGCKWWMLIRYRCHRSTIEFISVLLACKKQQRRAVSTMIIILKLGWLNTGESVHKSRGGCCFIFSHLQCKTLLKIWWGQHFSRISIKKLSLTSVTPLYIPSESRTRPFPPKTHTIWRNTNYFGNISASNISFCRF